MKYIIIIIQFATILIFSSCKNEKFFIKGEGDSVNNTRSMTECNAVSLSISATVQVIKDSVNYIELHGQQNILNVIETNVSGNELKIGLKRGTSIRKHNPISINVHCKDMRSVNVSGSGDVNIQSNFEIDYMNAVLSGSGSIVLDSKINKKLSANISGSGNIRYSGPETECLESEYNISGSGNIDAEWLKTYNVMAKISGSGNITVYAKSYLNANISGSGNVRYRGNPEIYKNISGSGKVIFIQ
jgi:hypothetical protein